MVYTEYDRKAQKKYNDSHKEKRKQNTMKRKEEMRAWLKDYRSHCVCLDCGESHPACLTFHHIFGEKEIDISHMIAYGYSVKNILKELEKCLCLCANCHAKRHWNERVEPAKGLTPSNGCLQGNSHSY